MFTESATKDGRSTEPPTKMEIDKEITFCSPIARSQRLHDSFLHLNRGGVIIWEMCNCVTERSLLHCRIELCRNQRSFEHF